MKYRPQSGARSWKPGESRPRNFAPARERVLAGGPSAQPDLLDADRAAFIVALDGADFELGEWEAEFTGSMFQRVERKLPLTDKMRVQIDRLMSRYPQFRPGPKLQPVRSTTREAWVPDDAQKLLSRGGGR
jgi:hypothetical protein